MCLLNNSNFNNKGLKAELAFYAAKLPVMTSRLHRVFLWKRGLMEKGIFMGFHYYACVNYLSSSTCISLQQLTLSVWWHIGCSKKKRFIIDLDNGLLLCADLSLMVPYGVMSSRNWVSQNLNYFWITFSAMSPFCWSKRGWVKLWSVETVMWRT